MSWQATNWVIEYSQHKGGALLVMLMIANCANEDGSDAFPGIERLARDTRMTSRQVQRIIQTLEKSGEIAIRRSQGRFPNHYAFPVMNKSNPDKVSGLNPDKMSPSEKSDSDISDTNPDISDTNPDIAMSSDPSVERSVEPSLPRARGNGVESASPKERSAPQREAMLGAAPEETLADRFNRERAARGEARLP